ncbi:hypothetical protein BC30075_2025 [Bacillus cereus]|nr:hypothetical protein BC30075_2025 [Bacillus cereus]
MNKDRNVSEAEKSFFERTIVSIYKVLEFIMKYTMILIIIMSIFVIIAAVYFKIYEGIGAGVFLLISSLFAYLVFLRKVKMPKLIAEIKIQKSIIIIRYLKRGNFVYSMNI